VHRTGEGRKRTGWPSGLQACSTGLAGSPTTTGLRVRASEEGVPAADLGAEGTAPIHPRVEGLTPLILTGSTGVVRYDGRMDELEPDGCDLDFRENPTADTDIDGIVLFAGIDPEDAEAVEDKAEAWRRLGELGVNDAS
jgi:hypothetical protein